MKTTKIIVTSALVALTVLAWAFLTGKVEAGNDSGYYWVAQSLGNTGDNEICVELRYARPHPNGSFVYLESCYNGPVHKLPGTDMVYLSHWAYGGNYPTPDELEMIDRKLGELLTSLNNCNGLPFDGTPDAIEGYDDFCHGASAIYLPAIVTPADGNE